MKQKPKVIVVVGQTATGKSDLAVHLAKKFNGEIISADSRQVYRGLDLGSGKITKKEMRGVPHWGLDVANSRIQYSAAEFQTYGAKAINAIVKHDKVPIVAGGTGLYVAVLLGEMSIPNVPPNPALRKKLEKKTAEQLFSLLKKLDSSRVKTIERKNPRRLIRAIEIAKAIGKIPKPRGHKLYDVLKIGLKRPERELAKRIEKRIHARLRRGMLAEARRLHERGLSWKRMEELGLEYRYMARHLTGKLSKEEMVEQLARAVFQYAKHQNTWFKRDNGIHWFRPNETRKMEMLARQFLTTHGGR